MLQGPDEEIMEFIDIANIACGYHAGDPSIMHQTVRLCKENGVKSGAHPGLPDMFGFGRRRMEIEPKDIYAMVLYQVGGLKSFLDAEGVPLNHIKAHGELYFYMQRDPSIMQAVLEACAMFRVPLYAAKNEKQKSTCKRLGIPFQEEIYVDIDYTPDGRLVPVSESVEATSEDIFTRITRAAYEDWTLDKNGKKMTFGWNGAPFSVGLHSDIPSALRNASIARRAVDEVNAKLFPDS